MGEQGARDKTSPPHNVIYGCFYIQVCSFYRIVRHCSFVFFPQDIAEQLCKVPRTLIAILVTCTFQNLGLLFLRLLGGRNGVPYYLLVFVNTIGSSLGLQSECIEAADSI